MGLTLAIYQIWVWGSSPVRMLIDLQLNYVRIPDGALLIDIDEKFAVRVEISRINKHNCCVILHILGKRQRDQIYKTDGDEWMKNY